MNHFSVNLPAAGLLALLLFSSSAVSAAVNWMDLNDRVPIYLTPGEAAALEVTGVDGYRVGPDGFLAGVYIYNPADRDATMMARWDSAAQRIVAVTTTLFVPGTASFDPMTNYQYAGTNGQNLTVGDKTMYSVTTALRFNLDSTALLTLTGGSFLKTGTGNHIISPGSRLTSGLLNNTDANPGKWTYDLYLGDFTPIDTFTRFQMAIVDNPDGKPVSLIKTGDQPVSLCLTPSAYTGETLVMDGRLNVAVGNLSPKYYVAAGAILELAAEALNTTDSRAVNIVTGGITGEGTVRLGYANGTVTLDGSKGFMHDGSTLASVTMNGNVTLSGGLLQTTTLSKDAARTFTFSDGTLTADAITFALTQTGGTLLPGAAGTAITGNYTLTAGMADLTANGLSATNVAVKDGTINLAGTAALAVMTITLGNVTAADTARLNMSGDAVLTATMLQTGGINGSTVELNIDGGTMTVGTLNPHGGSTTTITDGELNVTTALNMNNTSRVYMSGGTLTTPAITLNNSNPRLYLSGDAEVNAGAVSLVTNTLRSDGNYSVLSLMGNAVFSAASINLNGTVDGAELLLSENAVLKVGTLSKTGAGWFTFNGGTLTADAITFAVTQTGGTLRPGTGGTTISGNYTLTAGTADLTVNGLSATNVSVKNGTINLAGNAGLGATAITLGGVNDDTGKINVSGDATLTATTLTLGVAGPGTANIVELNIAGGTTTVGTFNPQGASRTNITDGTLNVTNAFNLERTGIVNMSSGTLTAPAITMRYSNPRLYLSGDAEVSAGTVSLNTDTILSGGNYSVISLAGEAALSATSINLNGTNDGSELLLSENAVLKVGTLSKTGAGRFTFSGGTLTAGSTVGFDLVQTGGTLAPGSFVKTTIDGKYDITGGTILMDISALDVHNILNVTGDMTFGAGSTLDINLLSGYVPEKDDSFELFTSDKSFSWGDLMLAAGLEEYWKLDAPGWVTYLGGQTPSGGGDGVPEPATWLLMALGAAGLAVWRWKSEPQS